MCLLRGPKGNIRVTYLTSRLSVSSGPPKLSSSFSDAHWPPLEAWHLGYIRTASTGGVYPLTCGEDKGDIVSQKSCHFWGVLNAVPTPGCALTYTCVWVYILNLRRGGHAHVLEDRHEERPESH
jgi:hypothetical protein